MGIGATVKRRKISTNPLNCVKKIKNSFLYFSWNIDTLEICQTVITDWSAALLIFSSGKFIGNSSCRPHGVCLFAHDLIGRESQSSQ